MIVKSAHVLSCNSAADLNDDGRRSTVNSALDCLQSSWASFKDNAHGGDGGEDASGGVQSRRFLFELGAELDFRSKLVLRAVVDENEVRVVGIERATHARVVATGLVLRRPRVLKEACVGF